MKWQIEVFSFYSSLNPFSKIEKGLSPLSGERGRGSKKNEVSLSKQLPLLRGWC
jgi:hypothetical protein